MQTSMELDTKLRDKIALSLAGEFGSLPQLEGVLISEGVTDFSGVRLLFPAGIA